MKPKLNQQEKAVLIQEVLEWAIANNNIMGPDTSRLQVLDVLQIIQLDTPERASANNQNIFVRELKQNDTLWRKVVPFLKNSRGGCLTEVDDKFAYGKCNHSADDHENGKCIGVHQNYYYDGSYNKTPQTTPCTCTRYKSTQTW